MLKSTLWKSQCDAKGLAFHPKSGNQLNVMRFQRARKHREYCIVASNFPMIIATCLSLAVAACSSGGGGTSSDTVSAGENAGGNGSGQGNGQQSGEGGSSPGMTSTASATASRASSVGAQADSLLMSTVHIQRADTQSGNVEINPSCTATSCDGSNAGIDITNSVRTIIDAAFSETADEKTVSADQGITLVKRTWETAEEEGESVVAALERSAFGVVVETRRPRAMPAQLAALTEREARRVYAVAYGDHGEARPSASGVWRGSMAGITNDPLEFLHGDAELSYVVFPSGVGNLSAEFSGITSLTRNAEHSRAAVRFTNIGVESSGSFSQGSQGSRIQGAFYGSSLEEIAGTFERYGIIAAYGAVKDSSPIQPSEPDVGSPGGGSQGRVPPSSPSTPVEEGPESSSAAHTRAGSVVDQANSFLMTRTFLRSGIAKWTPAVFETSCSALTCTLDPGGYNTALWTELTDGDADMTLAELDAYYENNPSFSGEPAEEGISVFGLVGEPLSGQEEGITERVTGSFAVMQFSLFGAGQIEYFADATPENKRNLRFGWAAGELAGSRPTTSGVYTGAMTGNEKDSGSATSGSATLTYTVSSTGGSLAADLGIASYSNISVSSSGSFSKSSGAANSIQGAFYRSEGNEIAGTFESSTHVGSFGATR